MGIGIFVKFFFFYLLFPNIAYMDMNMNTPSEILLRDKALMNNELSADQFLLLFPITWLYNGSNFKENVDQSAGATQNNHLRFRRAWSDWSLGKKITACVGGVCGALSGAGVGGALTASQFGWGAVPGAVVGAIGGFNAGADFANHIGYRRKRANFLMNSVNSSQFACELLRQVFLKSDHDQDGRLAFEDFGFTTEQSTQMLHNLDADKNNFIDPQEFNPCLSQRRLKRCNNCEDFKRLDSNSHELYSTPLYQNGYYVPGTNIIYI